MPNYQGGLGPENLDPNFLIAAEPEATEAAAPHIVTGEAPYSPLLIKTAEPGATEAAAPHIVTGEAPYSPLLIKAAEPGAAEAEPHIVTSGATSAVNIKGL